MFKWFRRKPCPDCTAKGLPSRWYVPSHVNHWAWGVVPGYHKVCCTCYGKGKIRAD